MATKAQMNAVYDAIRADAKKLIDDLVPFMFRSSAEAQLTVERVLHIARDAVAAYEKAPVSPPSIAGDIGSKVPPGAQA